MWAGVATCSWSQSNPDAHSPTAIPGVATIGAGVEPAGVPAADGDIHGFVVSPEGAVYEGVSVSLAYTNGNSAPARVATTDSDGRFDFSVVRPGAFELTVSANGFTSKVVSGVLRAVEHFDARSIVLLMGTEANEVMVTASPQEIAQEEVRAEEQQKVLGFLPNFYVVYAPNAPSLTKKQKFDLAWKSSIDPMSFVASGIVAGFEQANNSLSGYGQGTQGYAKRYGANYADNFISTMVGGAILPSLLKQDPRYFYKGTGTMRSRAFQIGRAHV